MRTFNIFDAEVSYDPSDPEPFRRGDARVGPAIGATRMAGTVYELPPGQSVCPYHYESQEEWLLVLRGQLTVRHPEGEDVLGPGDVTAFPAGPAGAHRTTNNGAETVRILIFATRDPIGYYAYPDSDKIGFWSDSPDPSDDVRVRRGQSLGLFDGEI